MCRSFTEAPAARSFIFARASENAAAAPEGDQAPSRAASNSGGSFRCSAARKAARCLQFLVDEFSCVGKKTALEIIKLAGKPLSDRSYPAHIAHAQASALHHALQKARVQKPRPDCLVPDRRGAAARGTAQGAAGGFLHRGDAPAGDAIAAIPSRWRSPSPSPVRAKPRSTSTPSDACAKGSRRASTPPQHLIARKDEPVRLLRFANRVPLLYQQASCAITKSVLQTNWRAYGLHQPKGGLPIAPMAILVHVASVWVPYTSEAKEAIEPYPELVREIKLGLQQCARRLSHFCNASATCCMNMSSAPISRNISRISASPFRTSLRSTTTTRDAIVDEARRRAACEPRRQKANLMTEDATRRRAIRTDGQSRSSSRSPIRCARDRERRSADESACRRAGWRM